MMADQLNSELAKAGALAKMRDLMRALDERGIRFEYIPIGVEPSVIFRVGKCKYSVYRSGKWPGDLLVYVNTRVRAMTAADVLGLCGLGAEP